jgi:hypothetical protein
MPRDRTDTDHRGDRDPAPERRTVGRERGRPDPRSGGNRRIARRLNLAALCLGTILVMSMALAGSAAAAPLWLVCLEGSGLTKYESSKCLKASGTGKWQSVGVPAGKTITVKLVVLTLLLKDTSTLLGESEVQCYGKGTRGEGVIEEGGKGTIRAFEVEKPTENCRGIKTCKEKEVEEVKGVNLPWKTEVVEEGGGFVTKILAGVSGKEPGWKVTCKTSIGSQSDECLIESASVAEQLALINEVTKTSGTEELLVKAHFTSNGEGKCSIGGAKASEITGKLAILLPGGALSIGPGHGVGVEEQPEFRLAEGTTRELAKEAKVSENLLLKATGEPTIECSKIQFEKGIITNDSPIATFKSIRFEGCVDKSDEKCTVPTIATAELKDTLQEDGSKGETDEKFKPKSGNEIAHFKLEGAECNETKELKLEGDFISKREDNEKSEDEHKLGIAVMPASDELEYGDQLVPALFCTSYGWFTSVSTFWYLA